MPKNRRIKFKAISNGPLLRLVRPLVKFARDLDDKRGTLAIEDLREQLWDESKARSLSSPAPPAGRAARTPSGWRRKAPTLSRWTSATALTACRTTARRKPTWPRR